MVDRDTQTEMTSADIDLLMSRAERTETLSTDASRRREPAGEISRHHVRSEMQPPHQMTLPASQTAATPYRPSRRSSVSVLNGTEHLYLIGGTTSVFARMVKERLGHCVSVSLQIEEYIPDTKTWQEVISIPCGVEWMSPAVATRHTSLYVIGEADYQRRNRIGALWKYNMAEPRLVIYHPS